MPQRKQSAFRLALPATSANLGPAFDAAALAFNLFIKIDARTVSEIRNHRHWPRP